MYKTVLIETTTNAKERAQKIENKANEMAASGYELVSVMSTPNFGAILVFKVVKP